MKESLPWIVSIGKNKFSEVVRLIMSCTFPDLQLECSDETLSVIFLSVACFTIMRMFSSFIEAICSSLYMSIDNNDHSEKGALEDRKSCLGVRMRMSQVIGVFMKSKNDDATRAKYKGTHLIPEERKFVVYSRMVHCWWLIMPIWIRLISRAFLRAFLEPEMKYPENVSSPTVRISSSSDDSFLEFTPPPCSVDRAAKMDADMISRAETLAFEEEHEKAITTIEFRIQRRVQFGQGVMLVGSVRELGSWDIARGITLDWSEGDLWTGTVSVKRADVGRLEYKYIVKSDSGAEWEAGGNHNVLKPVARHMVQEDFWAFPGYNIRV